MFKKAVIFTISFLIFIQQTGFCQIANQIDISRSITSQPNLVVKDEYRPFHLRYLAYDSQKADFNLLLDKGTQQKVNEDILKNTTSELLKYFFIGVSLPNKKFWVNLRPDFPNMIIDDELAKTDIGKILLEADLQLKRDTAKYTNPQTTEGKNYWNKLYAKAKELYGQENVSIPTLIRPWIVPDEIIVRESSNSAYIYKATMKVMLEQDYLKDNKQFNFNDEREKKLNEYSAELVRETIIPRLNKEINSAKRYAALRQVYYSLIFAQWFKNKYRGEFDRVDNNNLEGLESQTVWNKETYYQSYQKSFKNGEYNLKQSIETSQGQVIRSYYSGGMELSNLKEYIKTISGSVLGEILNLLIRKVNYLSAFSASINADKTYRITEVDGSKFFVNENSALVKGFSDNSLNFRRELGGIRANDGGNLNDNRNKFNLFIDQIIKDKSNNKIIIRRLISAVKANEANNMLFSDVEDIILNMMYAKELLSRSKEFTSFLKDKVNPVVIQDTLVEFAVAKLKSGNEIEQEIGLHVLLVLIKNYSQMTEKELVSTKQINDNLNIYRTDGGESTINKPILDYNLLTVFQLNSEYKKYPLRSSSLNEYLIRIQNNLVSFVAKSYSFKKSLVEYLSSLYINIFESPKEKINLKNEEKNINIPVSEQVVTGQKDLNTLELGDSFNIEGWNFIYAGKNEEKVLGHRFLYSLISNNHGQNNLRKAFTDRWINFGGFTGQVEVDDYLAQAIVQNSKDDGGYKEENIENFIRYLNNLLKEGIEESKLGGISLYLSLVQSFIDFSNKSNLNLDFETEIKPLFDLALNFELKNRNSKLSNNEKTQEFIEYVNIESEIKFSIENDQANKINEEIARLKTSRENIASEIFELSINEQQNAVEIENKLMELDAIDARLIKNKILYFIERISHEQFFNFKVLNNERSEFKFQAKNNEGKISLSEFEIVAELNGETLYLNKKHRYFFEALESIKLSIEKVLLAMPEKENTQITFKDITDGGALIDTIIAKLQVQKDEYIKMSKRFPGFEKGVILQNTLIHIYKAVQENGIKKVSDNKYTLKYDNIEGIIEILPQEIKVYVDSYFNSVDASFTPIDNDFFVNGKSAILNALQFNKDTAIQKFLIDFADFIKKFWNIEEYENYKSLFFFNTAALYGDVNLKSSKDIIRLFDFALKKDLEYNDISINMKEKLSYFVNQILYRANNVELIDDKQNDLLQELKILKSQSEKIEYYKNKINKIYWSTRELRDQTKDVALGQLIVMLEKDISSIEAVDTLNKMKILIFESALNKDDKFEKSGNGNYYFNNGWIKITENSIVESFVNNNQGAIKIDENSNRYLSKHFVALAATIIKDAYDNANNLRQKQIAKDFIEEYKKKVVADALKKSEDGGAPEKTGGIAFGNLPIQIQPLGNFLIKDLNFKTLNVENIDQEWNSIQRMVNLQIIPSASRVKKFLAVSYKKGDLMQRKDEVAVCLAEIFRIEELQGKITDPIFSSMLSFCDK